MKSFKVLLFACFILLFACGKDEDSLKGAKLRITCVSDNPYQVQINGSNTTTLPGNSFKDFKLSPGTHNVYYLQLSGYALYPTQGSFNVDLIDGSDVEYQIP